MNLLKNQAVDATHLTANPDSTRGLFLTCRCLVLTLILGLMDPTFAEQLADVQSLSVNGSTEFGFGYLPWTDEFHQGDDSTEPTEALSALSTGFPVEYYGWPVQYETFEEMASAHASGQLWNQNSGTPIVDGRAFLTWYAALFRFRVSPGQSNGDTITIRWKRDSIGSDSWMVWDHDKRCWDTENMTTNNGCIGGTIEWASWIYTHQTWDIQYDILFNGTPIPGGQSFHIFGYTMEAAGPTQISAEAGELASTPLAVRVVGYDGISGVPGETVRFSMPGFGSPGFWLQPDSSSTSGAKTLDTLTDDEGIARAWVGMGTPGIIVGVGTSSPNAPLDPPYFTERPSFQLQALSTEIPEIHPPRNLGRVPATSCIGNPVNVVTGNKFQSETDIRGLSGTPLEFTRFYNSQDSGTGSLGRGWRHSYEATITFTKEGKGKDAVDYAHLKRPDGRQITLMDSGAGWRADPDIPFSLRRHRGKWELRGANDEVETYDGKGILLSITDVRGNTQTLDYDNRKRLSQVVSTSGEQLLFSYDTDNRLVQVEHRAATPAPGDTASRVWAYNFKGENLTAVTLPDQSERLYHYEDQRFPAALTGITDQRGNRHANWQYDAFGRVTVSSGALGVGQTAIYYGINGQRTVTDSRGNTTLYTATAQLGQGLVTGTTGPTCNGGNANTETFHYDPQTNHLLTHTRDGITTQYGDYDDRGNPGFRIDALGTPQEHRQTFAYDNRFRNRLTHILEKSVYPGGEKITALAYDSLGNLASNTLSGFRPDGTPVSRTTTWDYLGPYGQRSRADGPRTDVTDTTIFEYYPDDANQYQHRGMLRRVIGPQGVLLRDNLQYNSYRQLVSETRPNGLLVTYQWEPHTDRLATMTETGNSASRTTRWTHLATGELESVETPDGRLLTLHYDEARRLVAVSDTEGNRIDYSLDSEGNLIEENIRDPGGNLAYRVTRSFDAYNRLRHRVRANETVDYHYSPDGLIEREVNGNGVETHYSYDALRRLVDRIQDAAGHDPDTAQATTSLYHDSQGNLSGMTAPNDAETRFYHDDLGNRIRESSPDTGETLVDHDSAGNDIRITDAIGQIFELAYDANNRLVQVTGPDSSHDLLYIHDTCHNGIARLCEVRRGANRTSFGYNSFGDTIRIDQQVDTGFALVNQSLVMVYDEAGRLTRMTYPGGLSLLYGYDQLGNAVSLELERQGHTTSLVSNATYQPFGPLHTMTLGNGHMRSLQHDLAYRITAINDPLYDAVIDYDANGNIVHKQRQTGDLLADYDALDRLVATTGPLGSQGYQYDLNANRTRLVDNGAITEYGHEPFTNRLQHINHQAVLLDANGNTTWLRGMNLSYSPDNRLVEVAGIARYGYNGLGQRVFKATQGGEETLYLYGPGGRLKAELDGFGQVRKVYGYFNGELIAMVDDLASGHGSVYYSHNDHLGTPQALSDENGSVVWRAIYKPFGEALVNEDANGNGHLVEMNIRFPGQYFDDETGLHYNYFRDYDPALGRYVQSDPLGLFDDPNTYTYVKNNPLKGIDPLGLWTFSFEGYLGAGGGVIISYNSGTLEFLGRLGVGIGLGLSYEPHGIPSPHSNRCGSGYILRGSGRAAVGLQGGPISLGGSVNASAGNAITHNYGGGFLEYSPLSISTDGTPGFGVKVGASVGGEIGSYTNWSERDCRCQ